MGELSGVRCANILGLNSERLSRREVSTANGCAAWPLSDEAINVTHR